MTDKEIYQTQVAKEEIEAAKKVEVNLYRYTETPDEITTRCQICFASDEANAGLEYIDKAAAWDLCAVCGVQNAPPFFDYSDQCSSDIPF